MTTTSSATGRAGPESGPPGVYVTDREPRVAAAPTLMSGVPVFIGFARPQNEILERRGVPAAVLTRWNADAFAGSVRPADGSFLPMAVRGFFANGGQRCVVLAAPPASGIDGLLDTLKVGGLLEDRSDIDLVCLPDAVSSLAEAPDAPYAAQAAALAHCERMGDRFAILDMWPSAAPDDADRVADILDAAARLRSGFGALYHPWIAVGRTDAPAGHAPAAGIQEWRRRQPSGRDAGPAAMAMVPPCGHVAGSYARLDAQIGQQSAPANIRIEDAIDVAVHLGEAALGMLNGGGVNCLRAERGRGIRATGARTLSSRANLALVSTARIYIGFRRWLAVGMRDLMFEPNSDALRDRIRRRLEAQCLALLRSGALAGNAASEAFFIKCDDETNGEDAFALGRVVAHVGLAPSVPAEYIVLRVEHEPLGVNIGSLP